jgi:MFS family permease
MFLMAAWHAEPWQVAASNAVTGTGIGLAFACLAGLIVAAVTPEQTGVASGMNANIRTIGGSVGTAVMASIVTAHFLPSGFPKEIGYTAGFLVLGGALVAAAVAGLMIPSMSEKAIEDKLEQERLDRELAVMGA